MVSPVNGNRDCSQAFPPINARRTKVASASDKNSLHHTQNMKKRLTETQTHLREDNDKVDEPQLKAMFETSAEVLGDYEKKNEAAWRK
jgi:hypothetical protein